MSWTVLMVLLLAAVVPGKPLGAEDSHRISFPKSGISIYALEPSTAQSAYQPIMMLLEVSDGFAPNVNVQVQPYGNTLDAYTAATLTQIEQARWILIATKKIGPGVVSYEYEGVLQGRTFHWYARAIKKGKRVYLATGTALASQWDEVAPEIVRVVDSIRLE